ncbi:MAG: DUF2914 domain-containing protein [Gammaproteobacteria bacterium]|nr:DUF2914 domain-containing protein [Gammaproteobacteria bacterium]
MNKKIASFCFVFFVFVSTGFVSTGIAAPANKPLGSVARAQFTTLIINKEPVDQVVLLGNDVTQVHYFTDLRHLTGQTITHRWEYNGDIVSDVSILVEGPRWRTYSRMILDPSLLGKWTALVVDESGWVLKATMFEYVPAQLAREKVPQ